MSVERERTDQRTTSLGRVDAIDVARGVALIGMAAYHLTWDLAHFGIVSPFLPFTLPMRLLSHAIAGAFLALAGVSLALAHRYGLNRPAFGERVARVAGGAVLVTATTGYLFPGSTVWFGILHCIVAASLLSLPVIEAPALASLAVGAIAFALPFFVQSKSVRFADFALARPRSNASEHGRLVPAASMGQHHALGPRRRAAAGCPPVADSSGSLACSLRVIRCDRFRWPA